MTESKTTLEVVQINDGHEVIMKIPNVISFREVDICEHAYAQGTWIYDTHTQVGKVICVKCGKEKP